MDDEEIDEELEGRLYAMIHYVDETQTNAVKAPVPNNEQALLTNTPKVSTIRRYWRTGADIPQLNTVYQFTKPDTRQMEAKNLVNQTEISKLESGQLKPKNLENKQPETRKPDNTQLESKKLDNLSVSQQSDLKQTEVVNILSTLQTLDTEQTIPKEEKTLLLEPHSEIIPTNAQKSLEILKNHDSKDIVELDSSDDDEVIEVVLPPKPTITIESSDEDEMTVLPPIPPPNYKTVKTNLQFGIQNSPKNHTITSGDRNREISASPVPSVVSSVSDDFIRGDCIAFNISSKRPDQPSFDFSLHGSDLLLQATPTSNKKKRKKNKNKADPLQASNISITSLAEKCFATPKNKTKKKKSTKSNTPLISTQSEYSDSETNVNKKKQKSKNAVSIIGIPNDTNSNHSVIENNKASHNVDNTTQKASQNSEVTTITAGVSIPFVHGSQKERMPENNAPQLQVIDLVDDQSDVSDTVIESNIIMGNVTGFEENSNVLNLINNKPCNNVTLGSTNVPEILSEHLDFDTQTGIFKFKSKRRLSEHSLQADMEKFYNESWGGENFNHKEILKHLPRDRNLWQIDPKDRLLTPSKRKVICNYCNRPGHRDDTCHRKPPVCHMCGDRGHREPRCPRKICVNCGSPNHMYSTMCRNCASWNRVTCAECGQTGHPSTHCPDVWRRYHSTIETGSPLIENRQIKKPYQLFCSGCSKRGHLIHTCRSTIPFSGLPVYSPYIANYIPIYPPTPKDQSQTIRQPRNRIIHTQDPSTPTQTTRVGKRLSNSPVRYEAHHNKKRYSYPPTANPIVPENNTKIKNQGENNNTVFNALAPLESKQQNIVESEKNVNKESNIEATKQVVVESMPDFIPITLGNHNRQGQIIQDNEVSTSDEVTSAKIYITKNIIDKFCLPEGEQWLQTMMQKHNITINTTDDSFLTVCGKLVDQEAFQSDLRNLASGVQTDKYETPETVPENSENNQQELYYNIPKNKYHLIKKLNTAFKSLNREIGDPNALFKELTYARTKHEQLLRQKIISHKQLSNNRQYMNDMLKKLNMILLGQARLADGPFHLRELQILNNRIISCTNKNISKELREQIALHYQQVFMGTPRDDYSKLLKIYYGNKTQKYPACVAKKVLRNLTKTTPKPIMANMIHPDVVMRPPQHNKEVTMMNIKNNMKKYKRQIKEAKIKDNGLILARHRLLAQLESYSMSLEKCANVTPKMFKKMWKVQNQAAQFLTKV